MERGTVSDDHVWSAAQLELPWWAIRGADRFDSRQDSDDHELDKVIVFNWRERFVIHLVSKL